MAQNWVTAKTFYENVAHLEIFTTFAPRINLL
jgi:hypothetical protein